MRAPISVPVAPSPPPQHAMPPDPPEAPDASHDAPPLPSPLPSQEERERPAPPRPAFLPDGVADRLAHAIEMLKLQSDKLAEMARSDALEIGFLVAERILEQELQSNPRALLTLVRSATRRLAESRELTVFLSPGDIDKVRAKITEGGPDAQGLTNVKLAPDTALASGDCRVQSELGTVDGRLSTRLADVRKSIDSEDSK